MQDYKLLKSSVHPNRTFPFIAAALLLAATLLLSACAASATAPQAGVPANPTTTAATPAPTETPVPATATSAPPTSTSVPLMATSVPTMAAPATAVAVTVPTPMPTIGTTSTAKCGGYTITQKVTNVLNTGRVTSATITDAQGQVVKTIMVDTKQGAMVGITRLQCLDLMGNGISDLVVTSFTGGADCCAVYDIYALTGSVPSIFHWNAGNGGIKYFVALDGPPPLDIVGDDNRFANFDSLPAFATPSIPIVYAFRNGQYVPATRDYPQVLQVDLAESKDGLAGCNGDPICQKSMALHIYADGVWLNQQAQTLTYLKGQVSQDVYTWLESMKADADKLLAQ
jgi:hypothetical protein